MESREEAATPHEIGVAFLALLRMCGYSWSVQQPGTEAGPGEMRAVQDGARPVVDELISEYVAQHAELSCPRHLAQVRSLMGNLADHAQVSDWRALTPRQITAFLDHCRDDGRERHDSKGRTVKGGRCGAGAKTRGTYLSMIRGVLAWAIRSEWGNFRRSDENPAERVTVPRAKRKKHRAWTLPESRLLLQVDDWERMVLYRFLLVTGMRIGAATGIPASFIIVDDEHPRVEIPEEWSKTEIEHSPALDPLTAKMLRILRAAMPDYSPNLPLFRRPRNDRLQADCLAVGVDLIDERGRGVGFNCFRRFVPTTLDALGIRDVVAQAQLGHRDLSTTRTYYVDSGMPDQSRAVNRLADALCEASEQVDEKSSTCPVAECLDARYPAPVTPTDSAMPTALAQSDAARRPVVRIAGVGVTTRPTGPGRLATTGCESATGTPVTPAAGCSESNGRNRARTCCAHRTEAAADLLASVARFLRGGGA